MCHPFSLGDWSLKSNRTGSGPWDLFAANMASLTVQMEAYAFRELVAHLQWRKDVQSLGFSRRRGATDLVVKNHRKFTEENIGTLSWINNG
jgi:hypothetical protein